MGIRDDILQYMRLNYKDFWDFSKGLGRKKSNEQLLWLYEQLTGNCLPCPEDDSNEAWSALLSDPPPYEIDEEETLKMRVKGYYGREGDTGIIKRRERITFYWLMRQIDVHFLKLMNLVESIRNGDDHYETRRDPKIDGGFRILNIPRPDLKAIQLKIVRRILKDLFPRLPNVFGFSGGKLIDALRLHQNYGVIIKADIVNAFGRIFPGDVMRVLATGGMSSPLSWYASNIICDLCFRHTLPQGSPSSPWLFDIAMRPLDVELNDYVSSCGGRYSRYADNFLISFPKRKFNNRVRSKLFLLIKGKQRKYLQLKLHHVFITNRHDYAVRSLGMNFLGRKIKNTRPYQRRIRKSMHHLNKSIELGLSTESAWQHLSGLMAFANERTLPRSLTSEHKRIKKLLKK